MNGFNALRGRGMQGMAAALLTMLVATGVHAQSTIKIGLMQGFTGPNASVAASDRAGVRLAVKEINDAGGLLGRKLEILESDDNLNPAQSVSEARRLVRDGVNFVLGPQASFLAAAAAPIFTEAKVVFISSTVSAVASPYNFSMLWGSAVQAQAMMEFAADKLKAKSIAVLVDSGPLGVLLQDEVKKRAPALGLNVVATEVFELNTPDITPQIQRVRRANPDVILNTGSLPADAGRLIRNMEELGWNPTIVSTVFAVATKGTMDAGGPDSFKSGKYYGLLPKSYTYCAKDRVGARPYDAFLGRLKALETADFAKIDHKSALMYYDAVNVLRAAIEGTKSVDGTAIYAWIERNAANLRGVAGTPLSANASSHFFIGANALTLVNRPDVVRAEDNLVERRFDC